ncbi:hypothetical protein Krac_2789 [Ktedonobacter racemifer DSM 44963]|uniref:Uncharacterized protein n=2 Tax=Ktedonobacter racemifer TaxID=363277 RepID=D6TZM5_KTERA|nr:hypothetical protein Krac_2789 [Ktedonobacter racemifer DSM 44963]
MLRGYDPVREISQWNLVVSLLWAETVPVGVALFPLYNNLFFIEFNLTVFIALSVLVFVCGLASPCSSFIRSRREKRERKALRQAALKENGFLLAPIQPRALSELSLPLHIEREVKSVSLIKPAIGGVIFIFALSMSYTAVVYGFSMLPFYLLMVAFLFGPGTVLGIPGIFRVVQPWMLKRYLYPSLSIDEDGITAHYGRQAITMRWRDVRYFGLTSSAMFEKALTTNGAFNREVYELCDGENIICWLAASFLEHDSLLRSGRVAFSDRDRQTEPLASLIVAKTGLPLYDLRLPAQKRARERAMKLAMRGRYGQR